MMCLFRTLYVVREKKRLYTVYFVLSEFFSAKTRELILRLCHIHFWPPNLNYKQIPCTSLSFYFTTLCLILCRIPLQAPDRSIHFIFSWICCFFFGPDSGFLFVPRLPPAGEFLLAWCEGGFMLFYTGVCVFRKSRPLKLSVNVGLFMLISRRILWRVTIYYAKCKE